MAQQQHPLKYSNPEVYQVLVVSPRLSGAEKYISILKKKKKKGSHNREHTTTGQCKWRSELGKEKEPIWVVPAA